MTCSEYTKQHRLLCSHIMRFIIDYETLYIHSPSGVIDRQTNRQTDGQTQLMKVTLWLNSENTKLTNVENVQ